MRSMCLAAALALAAATATLANGPSRGQATTYAFDGSFEDAAFAVENAIIGQGLVIDFVSHTGDMLNRTGVDVGSGETIFESADIYLFCSAVLSRRVMEADPMNIAHCPYGIFVTEAGGEVAIGYRNLPDGPMQEVEALLDTIAREAAGM